MFGQNNKITAETLIKDPVTTMKHMRERIEVKDIANEALLLMYDYIVKHRMNDAIALLDKFSIPEARVAAIAKIANSKPQKNFLDMLKKESSKSPVLAMIAAQTLIKHPAKETAQLALELLNKFKEKIPKSSPKLSAELSYLRANAYHALGNDGGAASELALASSSIKESGGACYNVDIFHEVAASFIALDKIGDAVMLAEEMTRKCARSVTGGKEMGEDEVQPSAEDALEYVPALCGLARMSKRRRFLDIAVELKDELEKSDDLGVFPLAESEGMIAETLAQIGEKKDAVALFKIAIERVGNSMQIEHELEVRSGADALFAHAMRAASSKSDPLLKEIFGEEDIDWLSASSFSVIEAMIDLGKRSKDGGLLKDATELAKRHSWKKLVSAMLQIAVACAEIGDIPSFKAAFDRAISNIPSSIFRKEDSAIAWKEAIEAATQALNVIEKE